MTGETDVWPCCREVQEGVPVSDVNGNKLGDSKIAAQRGIALVTFSRIGMAAPGMGEYHSVARSTGHVHYNALGSSARLMAEWGLCSKISHITNYGPSFKKPTTVRQKTKVWSRGSIQESDTKTD
jgi:hypothetical protein